jgi:fructose-1,6-bisphosphatase II / sedoheptulose-1,7-bisphosphatase
MKTLGTHLEIEGMEVANKAAIACAPWIGRGSEKDADKAATEAMRAGFNEMNIEGTIVIGEGERDEAPMLYIGEKVGKGGQKVDISLDPLEGTTICASNYPNSLAVLAFATDGGFLHAPDVYMDKIAVGPGLPEGVVDLDNSVETNLKNLAKAKGLHVSDLQVTAMLRPRHEELIAKIREAGARIKLIGDNDVAAICDIAMGGESDIYMSIGGAPEGVLASAALRTLGGQMQGRLVFKNTKAGQEDRAKKMGVMDLNRKYTHEEMAKGDVIFIAAGVTGGYLLDGVAYEENAVIANTLIMHSSTKTVRKVYTRYEF